MESMAKFTRQLSQHIDKAVKASQGGVTSDSDTDRLLKHNHSDTSLSSRSSCSSVPTSGGFSNKMAPTHRLPGLALSPTPTSSSLPRTLSRSISVPLPMSHSDFETPDPFPELASPPDLNYRLSMFQVMNFYNNDHSYKSLPVEEHLRAKDICELLAVKNHVQHDKTWSLVEYVGEYNLERTLEDHDVVLDVYENWSTCNDPSLNKFYFRKDFRKFELFENPAQFFPSHMMDSPEQKDDPLGLIETSERAKKRVIQNVFNDTGQLPDIHGLLYTRESTSQKKSWKKMFFVLRNNLLYYSTKGASKDPKYLVQFADVRHCTVYYQINARKYQSSPTDFCFVLKMDSSWSSLKYLCSDEESSRLCWVSSFRLVSYGKQLTENYTSAVKKDLTLDELSIPQFKQVIGDKCRVAIDFTGGSTRVIEDPNEAFAIAKLEEHEWRKKKAAIRPVNSPSLVSAVQSSVHSAEPWFFGGISREQSVELLTAQGLVDGLFLIRDSHTIPNAFVLTLAHGQKVKHIHIKLLQDGNEGFYSIDESLKFHDLIQLVEFYQANVGCLPCKLTHHVQVLA